MALMSRGVPNVEKLRRKGDTRRLLKALEYRDLYRHSDGATADLGVGVRRGAMVALREVGGPSAEQGAYMAVEDFNDSVRVEGVRALRELRLVDPLVTAVATWTEPAHATSRAEAAQALADFHEPALADKLAVALMHERAGSIADDDQARELLVELATRGARASGHAFVQTLIDCLGDADSELRGRAEEMLTWIPSVAVTPLIAALYASGIQTAVITVLGRIRDSRAAEPLVSLLTAPEAAVRARAAWALGQIKDPRVAQPLLEACTDSEYAVRAAATNALNELGTAALLVGIASFIRPLLANTGQPALPFGSREESMRALIAAAPAYGEAAPLRATSPSADWGGTPPAGGWRGRMRRLRDRLLTL